MRNYFHLSLLLCAPLLVTGCGDINDPVIVSPVITTTAITPVSVTLSWVKATDSGTSASALVYKVYMSGTNPAYQSFDTLGEVEAGTLAQTLTDASSATISGISAGAHYINIVVEDEDGNKALYEPLGEYFHANQISYYPFNGNTNDVELTAPNNLALAVDTTLPGLALPVVTSDRFSHAGSAYNFNPAIPQCLQSTADVGITGNVDRSVSFWVQSSNTPTGTRRAAFAWGDGANGSNFGATENGVGNVWTVWLGGAADVPTTTTVTSNWEHWVIGYTATTVYAYRNNVPFSNGTAAINTAISKLYVGCGMLAGVLSYPYQGNIDDVRIFSSLLNGTDVTNLYAATRP